MAVANPLNMRPPKPPAPQAPLYGGANGPQLGTSRLRNTPAASSGGLQQSLGARPTATPQPSAAPAPAPAPSASPYQQATSNIGSLLQSLFGGFASGGGSGGTSGGASANFGTQPYVVSSNPVAAGSFHSSGVGPENAAAIGAWQNSQVTGPRMQQGLGAQQYGSNGFDGNRVWDYLGTGMIGASNPVGPGYWHSSGVGPEQAAATGAWQNNQALNHVAQSMGYRGDQFALTDYGYDAAGNWVLGGRNSAPPAPAAPAASAPGGSAAGGGGGIAPINSTIDGQSGIYDRGQTQRNVNQMVEDARTKGSPRAQMKRYSAPGRSQDAGTAAAAAPAVGQSMATAAAAQAGGGLEDELANLNYQLGGQDAAGSETLALADLIRRLQSSQNNQTAAYQNTLLGGFGDIIGSLFGSL